MAKRPYLYPHIVLLLPFLGFARGLGGIPLSYIDFVNQLDLTERRDQTCPGPLTPTGVCNDLSTSELVASCTAACAAALCCSGECQGTCGSDCITYAPCLNLPGGGDGGGGGDGDQNATCNVLTIDYYSGFNVHFQVNEEDAKALMPDSRFKPLTSDDVKIPVNVGWKRRQLKKKSKGGGYPVSLYTASIGVEFSGQQVTARRADLFSYAIGPDQKLSLVILIAYVEVPIPFQSDPTLLDVFKKSITDLALDSRTGLTAFKHIFVNTFIIEKENYFLMGGGDLQEKTIKIALGNNCQKNVGVFPIEFTLANSITWRSPIDKNINYFNQDFIVASVSTYEISKDCPIISNIDAILAELPASALLSGIETYGSDEEAITWQFEDSTESGGTPFLTLAEKNAAIGLKRNAFSGLWLARSAVPETIIRLRQGANSVCVLWEIDEDKMVDMSNDLNLPLIGLMMAPIRTHVGTDSKYYLMLNVYTSEIEGDPSGEATRYEYSVFVKNEGQESDRPYYMVIEAGSSKASIDPVNGQTPPRISTISRDGDVISFQSDTFIASIDIGENLPLTADPEWIYANDLIFWGNGVYDKLYLDTSFTLQRPKKGVLTIESGSFQWSSYLVDINEPDYADIYEEENRFIVNPWNGIEKMQARLSQAPDSVAKYFLLASLDTIQAIKQGFVPAIALGNAAAIAAGQQPLVDFTVLSNYPENVKIMLNFVVSKNAAEEFARLINLPDGLQLVPMRVSDDSKNEIIVTLEVFLLTLPFEINGFENEFKATWTTYVTNSSTNVEYLYDIFPYATPRAMYDIGGILETAPEEFVVNIGASMDVSVKNAGTEFHVSAPIVSTGVTKRLSPQFVNVYNRVYWNKNVFDHYHHNGDLYYAKVFPIDEKKVTFFREGGAAWFDLINRKPFEAFYFDGKYTFVTAPYFNLEELYEGI